MDTIMGQIIMEIDMPYDNALVIWKAKDAPRDIRRLFNPDDLDYIALLSNARDTSWLDFCDDDEDRVPWLLGNNRFSACGDVVVIEHGNDLLFGGYHA
jgi:hypothetical protein